MEHSKPDSYDKAMDSWNNAKIRFNNAWPYLKYSGETVICKAVWLGTIRLLTAKLNSGQANSNHSENELTIKLPQPNSGPGSRLALEEKLNFDLIEGLSSEAAKMIYLSEVVGYYFAPQAIASTTLTAGLHSYAENPTNGQQIIKKAWYVVKNVAIGALNVGEAAWYLIDHGITEYFLQKPLLLEPASTEYSDANIENEESSPLGEEGGDAIPQE